MLLQKPLFAGGNPMSVTTTQVHECSTSCGPCMQSHTCMKPRRHAASARQAAYHAAHAFIHTRHATVSKHEQLHTMRAHTTRTLARLMYETGFRLELMSNLHNGAAHSENSGWPTHRDHHGINGHDVAASTKLHRSRQMRMWLIMCNGCQTSPR
jgi:hypothetical protein